MVRDYEKEKQENLKNPISDHLDSDYIVFENETQKRTAENFNCLICGNIVI
jgi:hypothetical protein